jgi:sulfur-carrier protein adenylyltransferase/sulfurtransferase
VLPGIVGSIQAVEAIKLILGVGEDLSGRRLAYDSLEQSFRTYRMPATPSAPRAPSIPSAS